MAGFHTLLFNKNFGGEIFSANLLLKKSWDSIKKSLRFFVVAKRPIAAGCYKIIGGVAPVDTYKVLHGEYIKDDTRC